MMKYIFTPMVSFFIMLIWAATFGETIEYLIPGKNMLEEYILINQLWLTGCIIKSLHNKIVKS